MGLVSEGLNLIVCPLWQSPQAKACEQVQFIPLDRFSVGLLRSGNVFHPTVFLLMITNDQFYYSLFWGKFLTVFKKEHCNFNLCCIYL